MLNDSRPICLRIFFFLVLLTALASGRSVANIEVSLSQSVSERGDAAGETLLDYNNGAFEILYSSIRRGPVWSKYFLPADSLLYYDGPRPAAYRLDTRVDSYDGSSFGMGYDRGHLVPAEDMRHAGQAAFNDTFLTSNVTPMASGLNRGAWSTLEARGRSLARGNDGVLVYSGAHFEGSTSKKIGSVSVPTHYWKAFQWINSDNEGESKYWLIPNRDVATAELPKFEINREDLERKIGISFLNGSRLASPLSRSSQSDTLEKAISDGSLARVNSLLSASISPWQLVETKNELGENSVHLAAKFGNAEILKALLSKSLSPWKLLETKDANGRSPLHNAAINGDASITTEILAKSISPWKLIDQADSDGRTPLHYAAIAGKSETIRVLLSKSLSPFTLKRKKDHDGKMPSDLAVTDDIKDLLK